MRNEHQMHALPVKDQLCDRYRTFFYAALMLVIIVACLFISSKNDRYGIITGGFLGLLAHWMATRRCTLRMSRRMNNIEIELIMNGLNYVSIRGNPYTFRPNLPRWLYFDHQTVSFENRPDGVSIIGPKISLNAITNRMFIM